MPGSAKSKPPVHLYDDKGKWLGFIPTKEAALAWIKRKKKKGVTVSDTPPPRVVLEPEPVNETTSLVDAGLDKALAKAKAKK